MIAQKQSSIAALVISIVSALFTGGTAAFAAWAAYAAQEQARYSVCERKR